MSPELSRRNFLKVGTSFGALQLLKYSPFKNPEINGSPTELSFTQIVEFVLLMDNLHHELPDYVIPMDTNKDLQYWTEEIVPQYEQDGFIEKAIYPESVTFQDMHLYTNHDLKIDGKDPLNTQAFTTCENGSAYDPTASTLPLPIRKIYINDRITHPVSSEYHSSSSLIRLVHELGHVQQGTKCLYNSFIGSPIETSAQTATPEILSSMALEGNKYALFSLVDFMREIGMNAAKFKALSDPKIMSQYEWLVKRVYRKPSEKARLAETNLSVKKQQNNHLVFLDVYNYIPLKKLLLAHKYTYDVVEDLEFPNRTVVFDGFGYFIDNSSKLIAEYTNK